MDSTKKSKYRQRERKERILMAFGWKCDKCGLEGACPAVYDLHHKDGKHGPMDKFWFTVKISDDLFEDWLSSCLKRCKLLCSNCHREEHYGGE